MNQGFHTPRLQTVCVFPIVEATPAVSVRSATCRTMPRASSPAPTSHPQPRRTRRTGSEAPLPREADAEAGANQQEERHTPEAEEHEGRRATRGEIPSGGFSQAERPASGPVDVKCGEDQTPCGGQVSACSWWARRTATEWHLVTLPRKSSCSSDVIVRLRSAFDRE